MIGTKMTSNPGPKFRHFLLRPVLALLILAAVVSVAVAVPSVDLQTERTSGYESCGSGSITVSHWIETFFQLIRRDKEGYGLAPTVLSRISFIVSASMYDAWAAYDGVASPTLLKLKTPKHTSYGSSQDQETAINYAAYRAFLNMYPLEEDFLKNEMRKLDLDPDQDSSDTSSSAGIGNLAASKVIESRRDDNSNQYGDMPGSNGKPYSDFTGYQPKNTVDNVDDPNYWQPLRFFNPDGTSNVPGFLTPHWGKVTPFGQASGSQFLPGAQPQYGSEQLKEEVEELVRVNADLDLEKKAIVEFMRGGPGSYSPFGLWLQFTVYLFKRDCLDLSASVKMFFGLSATGLDSFIGAWNTKRHHDSSRPWTLVRAMYAGQKLRGWGGPGKGTVTIDADEWLPYAPLNFITPPFPGYVSGHSTASTAMARFLELYTNSDKFGYQETWTVGSNTEPGFPCSQIQGEDGKPDLTKGSSCQVSIDLPTFSETARLAGISRIYGGYHIRSDHDAGAKQGMQIAEQTWHVLRSYFTGQTKSSY